MGQEKSNEATSASKDMLRRTYSKSYMNHNFDSCQSFGFYFDVAHYDVRIEFGSVEGEDCLDVKLNGVPKANQEREPKPQTKQPFSSKKPELEKTKLTKKSLALEPMELTFRML